MNRRKSFNIKEIATEGKKDIPRQGTRPGGVCRRHPQTRKGTLNGDGWRGIAHSAISLLSLTIHWSLRLSALYLVPAHLLAWTNGELSIWFDPDRGHALEPVIQKFTNDTGIKVKLETPENTPDSFAMAA
jgi:hypothetical protein